MPKVWSDLGDHDKAVLGVGGGAVVDLQELLQVHQRQQLVAQPQDRGVLDALDAVFGVGPRPHQFDDRQLRDRKAVAGGFHDQGRDDGQGQRDLDGDGRALAGHRLDVDGAADLVDIGAHHVHADAAAGDRGDGSRGREARREDELVDLGFRHLLQIGLGDQTVLDRLGLDPLGVEAAAVVGDADDDVAAFMVGGQPDGALLGLAAGDALGGGLQTMVGGVAHHVRQGILDQVEHQAVEFGVGAVHFEFDLLAEFAGEVADDARQLLPGVADRLHPRLHDAFLQLGGDVGEPLQRHLELGVLVAAGDFQKLVAGQDQLGHHRHQVFQRVDVDADRLVGDLVGLLDVGLGGDRLLGLRLRFFDSARFRGRFRHRRGGGGCDLGDRRGCGRRDFDRGLAEGAFEVVERDFAGTQRTFQHLVDQRAGCAGHGRSRGRCRGNRGGGDDGDRCGFGMLAFGHLVQFLDQVFVGAFGFGLGGLEAGEDFLDAVDRGQDQRHRTRRHRHAVAEFAHQGLAGVGQRFEPGQPEEAAGALDGVNQPEDVIQNLRISRVLFEPHQLIVDRIQALVGLGEELPQKIVHQRMPSKCM